MSKNQLTDLNESELHQLINSKVQGDEPICLMVDKDNESVHQNIQLTFSSI